MEVIILNDLAIVICNYNKKDFIINCIESIFYSYFRDFDLIVVDNASTDGSAEAIKMEFGTQLTLLVNEENLGGSGGFARGMQFALDKGYKYIHLLDNDVVVEKDAVGSLYEFMEKTPDAGACGSLICQMQNPEFIQDFGAMIVPKNLGVKPLHGGKKRDSSLPDLVECDYVAACSAIYRTETLKKTGVIDREFFIYWDDMALSWEIRKARFKVYAISKSIVFHNHGLIGSSNTFGTYYFFRNKVRVFAKYLDDNEYEEFVQNLVKRIFRTFAANRAKSSDVYTYFHAFNDVLNDIRGKADEYKIVEYSEFSYKLNTLISIKSNIIIIMRKQLPLYRLQRLIEIVNSRTKAKITLAGYDGEYGNINGVCIANNPIFSNFDLIIEVCPHILDIKEFEYDRIYIDEYFNQLVDKDDFDFVKNLDEHYKFFHSIFYIFVKSKLNALREKIRPKEW
jgi:GT2 family glycosyltransferase